MPENLEFSLDTVTTEVGPAVKTPDTLHEYGPEVTEALRNNFQTYWKEQRRRITNEKFDYHLTPQEAFDKEVDFFTTVVTHVGTAVEAHHGGPVVVLLDADETIGRVEDTNTPVRVPGLSDKPMEELTEGQQRRLGMINMADEYARFQVRPAFAVTIDYLHQTYGDKVQFGILSTKNQKGLNTFFREMLDEACPERFEKGLIMSSKDGPAVDELIGDVLIRQKAAVEAGQEFTFEDALTGFVPDEPEARSIVPERLIDTESPDYSRKFGLYDSKELMLLRLLERYKIEGDEALKRGETDVPPEAYIMLIDDAVKDIIIKGNGQIEAVKVDRFRLPDDIY